MLTDTGGACALRGRPAVALDYYGKTVDVRGDYFPHSPSGGTPKVGTVTLAHRGSAAIWLAVAVAEKTRCHTLQIDGFLLRLPHQRARDVRLPVIRRDHYSVCASRSSHELDFSQFLAGRGR